MSKSCRFIVLAEDRSHERFARRYIYTSMQASYHDVYVEPIPSGRGCGEQWVRERYAKAVEAYRSRFARTALVVVIDADTCAVEQRVRQLQNSLTQANLSQRTADERIAHLVPKRSIETWILCLGGNRVDEDTDYSHRPKIDEQIPAAAETFFMWTRENARLPAHCLPSLLMAIPEARRLE